MSHWTEECKIPLLHVGLVGKLEPTHRSKVKNQNNGKLQNIPLKFRVTWILYLKVYFHYQKQPLYYWTRRRGKKITHQMPMCHMMAT